MPDTAQKFELDNFAVCYNKYPLAALYAPANAHLKSDTLVQTLSLVSPYLKFSSDKRDFIELWWRVFIDSSMANKLLGIEFNDADYTLIFWD